MTLRADIEVTLGRLDLAVAVDVGVGEVVAVVGPNGAGKTTLLRAIAGLVPLRRGHVDVGGDIGMVFQGAPLFPHLSAIENVAFGPRAQGRSRADAAEVARTWLQRVGAEELAHLRPDALSGGQAQRVAIARAMAVEPALLLLDEPFAALDAGARVELRRCIRSLDVARLLVTHDVTDALALADRIVVLEDGRVVQEGPVDAVAAAPRSAYAADLVGVNRLTGHATGGIVTLDGGAMVVSSDEAAGPVTVIVHPRAIALHKAHPEGSPRNVFDLTVAAVDPEGGRVRVALTGEVPLVAEVTAAALAELGLGAGDRVWASVKATEVALYPA